MLLQTLEKVKVRYLVGLFMCLLPFSHFFLKRMNIWDAQGRFFQIAILIFLSFMIYKPSVKPTILKGKLLNPYLSLLTLCFGLSVMSKWYDVLLKHDQFAVLTLFPFLNFIMILIFYRLIISYITSMDIEVILRYFTIPITIICIYSILQFFNLDQFYKFYGTLKLPDSVVGTIGNPSQLAGYLAMCLPILYYINNSLTSVSIILCWIVIFLTGSASGLFIAVITTIFYNIFYRIRFRHERLLAGFLVSIGLITCYLKKFDFSYFFSPSGRIEFWGYLWSVFKKFPITGAGLGFIRANELRMVNTSIFNGWKHAHNEFYQVLIENGLIAGIIVISGIIAYYLLFFNSTKSPLEVCLTSIFLSFILFSLVSYPAHLYLTSTLGMFSYAGLFVIEGEKI